jgi:putative nucleic acid binding protein
MRQSLCMMTFLALGFVMIALDRPAPAQSRRAPKGQPIKLTAEQLVKECEANSAKANAKYKGKTLRVTGVVGDIYDDMLYLPVKGKNETVRVGIRFGEGNKPPVKKGDKATFEGEFELVAVLGPLLVKCKLVEDDGKKKK